jgi:hypothetical protein
MFSSSFLCNLSSPSGPSHWASSANPEEKTCLVDFAATVAVFVFFRHWVCPSSEWFTFIQLLAEPLSYIGRTPEKKIELIRRRGAGQVSELWRYICRKLMRLHKWMTCCEKVLLACEVFPQIFVQCRSLICPYLLHESLTWKERLLHISILKCSHRHPHLHVSPRSGVFFVTMLLQWLTTAFSKVTTTSYNTQWWKTNGRLLHESLTNAFMN